MTGDALLKHAKDQHAAVIAKLKRAQADIEQDIEENEGVYPQNGGRLTQAELIRRARIGKTTLQGEVHKDTTRKSVNAWLKHVRRRMVLGHKAVRRKITDRAERWKFLYHELADTYAIAELEFVEAQNRIANLEGENEKLREEISSLRSKQGNVVPFPA